MPDFNPNAAVLGELTRRLNEAPFAPFRIVMSSGKSYQVPTPDHLTITRLRREIIVETDGYTTSTINPLHVTAIERLEPERKAS